MSYFEILNLFFLVILVFSMMFCFIVIVLAEESERKSKAEYIKKHKPKT